MHSSSFKDMHDIPHSIDEGLFCIPVTVVYAGNIHSTQDDTNFFILHQVINSNHTQLCPGPTTQPSPLGPTY
eukprot:8323857-Ditylum_brightwellii.AAC.1